MWKSYAFYYLASFAGIIYFTPNVKSPGGLAVKWGAQTSHLPFGRHEFFSGDKEIGGGRAVKNKNCGKRRNFEKTTSVCEYITSIPNVYNHKGKDSSLQSHIQSPALVRRGISRNGIVNMIIVYGGRVTS